MTCPATYLYNDDTFRKMFRALDNAAIYPQVILQMYWDQAGTIISNTSYGFLAAQGGPMAMNLMTAHLAALSQMIANGEVPQIATGASIDKISVTLEAPPTKSMFDWWLATTPYGMQLLAMMGVASAGGFYTPGSIGRAGFFAGGANGYNRGFGGFYY